jgi:endonuclease/exonuclease/phosphatase family metal-dependent hydrolase
VPATGRILSWNLHYGVGPTGAVDLEAVAQAIEAHNPDVVLLQEVSRGWVQGGGVDMATWLSQRLDRPFVFGGAADGRFGNVILARGALADPEVLALPFGGGPQQRSALSAHTEVGGVPVRATSIHLQHRPSNSATRVRQVQTFLDSAPADPDEPPRILGGDLNATPGRPEVELLLRAGFVSAVDTVGDPGAFTDPSTAPYRRIDWVFGRGIGFSDAQVLTQVQLSDHLPLLVTVDP